MNYALESAPQDLGVPSTHLSGPEAISYPDGYTMDRYAAFGLSTWSDYLVDLPTMFYFDYLDNKLAVIMCQMPVDPTSDAAVIARWLEHCVEATYDYELLQSKLVHAEGGQTYLRDPDGNELVVGWDVPTSTVYLVAVSKIWALEHPWTSVYE